MSRRSRMGYVAVFALALLGAEVSGPQRPPPNPLEPCRAELSTYRGEGNLSAACTAALEKAAYAAAGVMPAGTKVQVGIAISKVTTAELDVGGRPDPPDPVLIVPAPTALSTGTAGCETGTRRPVVGTSATLSLSALLPPVFELGSPRATFEYEQVDGPDEVTTSAETEPGEATVSAQIEPDRLAPGMTYRWRVRATPQFADTPGWSRWCEFAVAAGAPDYRGLDSGQLPIIRKLGLRPERRYTVALPAARWQSLREVFPSDGSAISETQEIRPGDAGGTTEGGEPEAASGWAGSEPADMAAWAVIAAKLANAADGRVTMTGAQWATTLSEAETWAELAGEDDSDRDGSAYRETAALISARLAA